MLIFTEEMNTATLPSYLNVDIKLWNLFNSYIYNTKKTLSYLCKIIFPKLQLRLKNIHWWLVLLSKDRDASQEENCHEDAMVFLQSVFSYQLVLLLLNKIVIFEHLWYIRIIYSHLIIKPLKTRDTDNARTAEFKNRKPWCLYIMPISERHALTHTVSRLKKNAENSLAVV